MGVPLVTGMALAGVASCDEQVGNDAAARAEYRSLLELGEAVGEVDLIAAALEGLARAADAEADPVKAAELLGRADGLRQTYDRPRGVHEEAARLRVEASSRAALGERRYSEAVRRGGKLGLGAPR